MKCVKNVGKKLFVVCLTIILVLLSLTGCKKDGAIVSDVKNNGENTDKTKAMGRYVEKDIKLPDGENSKSILHMEKDPKGNIVLFVKDLDSKYAEFNSYTLKDDNTWEKQACQWLNNLKLDSKEVDLNITWGADNNLYADYRIRKNEEEIPQTKIVTTKDGIKTEEIEIADLAKKDANGYVPLVMKLLVLANGNMVLNEYSEMTLYNRETGELVQKFSTDRGIAAVLENSIYHYNVPENSIDIYDGSTGEEITSFPAAADVAYDANLDVRVDKSVVFYSASGIQVRKDGSDLWEAAADSSIGSIGAPKYYSTSFAAGNQEDYYVLYDSMEEVNKLSYYVFDKDAPLEADTTLTVYALRDNSVIRQAASDFQSANPNVRIDFQVAFSDSNFKESTMDLTTMGKEEDGAAALEDDYIRTLNTQLLAGKGPDVIIMDGLPEESYIEKGVLKDISSIIDSMVSSGDLLPNIASAYRKDGKIYTIPSKIGIPMAFGEEELTKYAGDPEKLSKYMKQNPGKSVFGVINQERIISYYLDVLKNELFHEDGSLNEEKIKSFLENMKIILDSSEKAEPDKQRYGSSEWDLIEEGNGLFLDNITGFYQSQSCFSTIELINASFSQMNQSFIPIGKIGINSAGKNQKIAEQFMQTVLSEEVQNTDFYDGFPVNKKSLEGYLNIERTSGQGYGGSFQGADGKTYDMVIKWPVKESRQGIVDICELVTQEAVLDKKLKKIIYDKSGDYFTGKKSSDEVIAQIVSGTKAYLTE